jgi:arylsulfatase A-like enzyme
MLYDGEIRHNDALIKKLFNLLSSFKLNRNTLVIFMADHGEHLGEHGSNWGHYPPGYRQVTGVPLMLLYPARFSTGKRIEETVQLMDVMPTVLELAGIPLNDLLLQGDSMVNLIEGRNLQYWRDRIVVSEEVSQMVKHQGYMCGSFFFRGWHLISTRNVPRSGWKSRLPGEFRLRNINFKKDPAEASYDQWFVPDLYLKWIYRRTMSEIQNNDFEAFAVWTKRDRLEKQEHDPDAVHRLKSIGHLK